MTQLDPEETVSDLRREGLLFVSEHFDFLAKARSQGSFRQTLDLFSTEELIELSLNLANVVRLLEGKGDNGRVGVLLGQKPS